MAHITTVDVTNGVPTAGTGTVYTIDQLLTQGLPISDGTVTNIAAIKAASTAPSASDKALVVSISPNSVNANGQATMTNSGPVVIASDQSAVAVKGSGTAGSANSGVVTVQGIASMTKLLVTPDAGATVQPIPATSGGLTISSTLIASGTNATSVKASAGQIYKVECFNNSTNIGYLKIYNTAGTPTAGSGTPVIRLMVPASGGVATTTDMGLALATGIGFTFTGGIADADTTSVAASAFIVNIYYK